MRIIKTLGSLRITFLLLLALAAVSVIGTVIAQGNPPQYYLQTYGQVIGRAILFLQADDLYSGWFYILILGSVWLNLSLCTVNTFNIRIFKNKKKTALFLVHFSILVIFTGSLISNFKKESAYLRLSPGDSVALEKADAEIEFKGFEIEYYGQSDRVKEYRSLITLKQKGLGDEDHRIMVNHPFRFKGYGLYQSSFEVFADVELSISHMGKEIWSGEWRQGEVLALPGDQGFSLQITHFVPDALIDEQGNITLNSYKLGNTALLISLYRGQEPVDSEWIFKDEKINNMVSQKIEVFDFNIRQQRPFYVSVIQIIRDPGVTVVLAGFLILFLGLSLFVWFKRIF